METMELSSLAKFEYALFANMELYKAPLFLHGRREKKNFDIQKLKDVSRQAAEAAVQSSDLDTAKSLTVS